MNQSVIHRYSLNRKDVRKTTCPYCGKKSAFTLYWDNLKGQIVDASCGKCDRLHCVNFTPKMFFEKNPDRRLELERMQRVEIAPPVPKIPVSDVLPDWMQMSVDWHLSHPTNFAFWLNSLFNDWVAVSDTLKKYNVGATGHFVSWSYFNEYAPLFWYVDVNQNAIDCKSIQYKPDGHRDKQNQYSIKFYHKRLEQSSQTSYKQHNRLAWIVPDACVLPDDSKPDMCLFGEHLLSNTGDCDVAIVESEKTALIASLFFRDTNVVWLASGGLGNLSVKNIHKLHGRRVLLFPDTDGTEQWQEKRHIMQLSGLDVLVIPPKKLALKIGLDVSLLSDKSDIADVIETYMKLNRTN